jgi:hypothetical protein
VSRDAIEDGPAYHVDRSEPGKRWGAICKTVDKTSFKTVYKTSFIGNVYGTQQWRETYRVCGILPNPDKIVAEGPVLPPPRAPGQGGPKARIRSTGEVGDKARKAPRTQDQDEDGGAPGPSTNPADPRARPKRTVTCGKCGTKGHNAAGCKTPDKIRGADGVDGPFRPEAASQGASGSGTQAGYEGAQ